MIEGFFLAIATSFAVIFLGEFGDKSQFMAMSFATKYRRSVVVAGILIATSLLFGAAVAVGASLGSFLPTAWITLFAGLVFIAFGLWTLRPEKEEDTTGLKYGRSGLLTVTGALMLAELGDKSMFLAITLSSSSNPWGVWIGAVLGMSAADIMAVFAGAWIATKVSAHYLRWGSAALFFTIGAIMTVQGILTIKG